MNEVCLLATKMKARTLVGDKGGELSCYLTPGLSYGYYGGAYKIGPTVQKKTVC